MLGENYSVLCMNCENILLVSVKKCGCSEKLAGALLDAVLWRPVGSY
jgi:hypothetical protein